MKVAFLSFFNGVSYRGAETYVDQLAGRLGKLGHEVVVYQNGTGTSTDYLTGKLVSVNFLPSFASEPDILIPVNGRLQAVKSRIWTKLNKKKMVVSGQSGIGFDDRINLYSFPDTFVGLTSYQCDWAKKTNPMADVVRIPNGVDTRVFHSGKSTLKLDLPTPVYLYVAAFEPIKRHDLLVKAMAKINGSLLMVGRGSLKEPILDLCKELLGPRRYVAADFSFSQMPDVYRAADVFVYPTSPWESFGIAQLEAMASGLPVVASDDPIRREIIGEAGIFVDPEDSNAFAKGLIDAYDRKWGNIPVIRAQDYSWDRIAGEYSNLFDRLKS